jgi:hypothetical protein
MTTRPVLISTAADRARLIGGLKCYPPMADNQGTWGDKNVHLYKSR